MASGDDLNTPLRHASGPRCAGLDPAQLGVADIDWTAPWLADWRAVGEPLAARIAAGQPQPQVLTAAGHAPVCFVPQADLPDGMAYEAFIGDTKQVPTREGLHDFFNALCWMHFPLAKARLNRLQAAEIARDGVQGQRGPVRDAITVFDENAVLIQAPDSVWQALTEHRWHDALVAQRALWVHCRIWMFGHAALEKLVQPYKSITAHVWRVPVPLDRAADSDPQAPHGWDDWLRQQLSADALAAKPYTPLPVLGTPGWWPANADPAYYQDPAVFRPPRPAMARP